METSDYKIETVTPNKLYVLKYEEGAFDYDDIGDTYVRLKESLPEGSSLIFIPGDMDLEEMDIEEVIGLRDYLTNYLDNLPVNKE